MEQIIIHVDMDAFFAAVEIRDDPSLKGKPLIIGSMPNERGVVSTCSYEARKYGVHSAMNIKDAYRLCPHGVFMHPNMEKYMRVSMRLHEIWNEYATALESVAFDEAYLDVTERAGDFDGAREIAMEIKRRIKDELQLTCSVGVAYSKTAAKTASEEKKPNGYFEIRTPEDFVNLMAERDVRELYTVGQKTAEKLHAIGIRTVRDAQERQDDVKRLLGKQGGWLVSVAFGSDDRKVVPYRPEDAKSIGREITFQKDVDDFDYLKDVLLLLAVSVERRAKRVGLFGKGVSLKITYADMKTVTRSQSVSPTDSAMTVYRTALSLLKKITKQPVRLVGTGIYNLTNEKMRQMRLSGVFEDDPSNDERELLARLNEMQKKYGLDFAGHLDQIYKTDTLYRTIEYMRKHK
ncbi:MAG: DNA polymerase IV [Clostridia bacterium]|nr:DNA polymerase IV [Clostridia bacterium]